MFFANLSKRKVLLLIINSMISVLMISCIIFLYYYLPTGTSNTSDIRTFTIEKDQSVNLKKSSYSTNNNLHNNNKIKNKILPGLIAINSNINSNNNNNNNLNNNQDERDENQSSSVNDDDDDTIYIDNDNYMDENYYNSVGNNVAERPLVNPVTPSVVIIKRPLIKIPKANSQYNEDFYYDSNYDYETDDDSDDVSSGNGRIIVNIKSIVQKQKAEVPENVYSVSSEIVSNLKNKYDKYNIVDQKQINKPDISNERTDTEPDTDSEIMSSPDDDETLDDDWAETKKRRLIGNKKKSNERSRQLLLCESAGSGELCRMLFKG